MKIVEIEVFSFEELSESAKKKAIEWYRNADTEMAWATENRESMEKFAEIFPIKVTDWSYGGRGEGVDFHFVCDDCIEELSGQRLSTYIWNNYRKYIYKPKQYWICSGHHNCVGIGAKHIDSKIWLYDEYQCPLTGYYMDDEILAPLYNFMRNPLNTTSFKDLLKECFSAWVKACNDDVECQNSDEHIIDAITANDYEFKEDGTKF